MARGLLGGIVLGGVVGAAGLALLSQSLPMPDGATSDAVPATQPAEPDATQGVTAPEPVTPAEPPAPEDATEPAEADSEPEAAPAPPTPAEPAPEAAPAAGPSAEAAPSATTDSPAEPATAPAEPGAEPAQPAGEAAPAATAPEAAAPDAVAPEAAPAPDTETATAPAPADEDPAAPAEDAAVEPQPETAPETAPETSAETASEPAPETATATDAQAEILPKVLQMAEAPAAPEPAPADDPSLPAGDAAPAPDEAAELDAATPAENAVPLEVAPAPTMPKLTDSAPELPAGEIAAAVLGDLPMAELPQPGTTTTIAVLPSDMSESEAVPETADGPPPPPLTPEEEALLQPAPAPTAEPAPALIVPDEPPVAGQGSLAPDPGLPMAGAEAETGRLPQIGTEPAATAEPAPVAEAATDTRPLVQFARPYTREAGKPLFSILMVDPGGPDVDRTTLAALPFPVTFVIDPMAPDAATAEAIYRAAGQEVVMAATGIPEGATAADLEQTFQAHAAALPQAVAVIDLPEGGFGENRPLATLAVPVIEAQGRGLITYDVGLNAGDQVARRADMPAATIFRRLDAEDESKPVIRRYLDRAAFRAAQDGQVMVIGSTRPETVAAILEWTVEGRATTVSLAPASAVLLAQ